MENLGQKQMSQNILLEESYPKSKRVDRNQLLSYQEQYSQLKGIMRFTIRNYSSQWRLLQSGDNICQMPQRSLKFGWTMKISNISKNYTNSVADKQDSIQSSKTTTLYYNISQKKQTQKQMYYLERIKQTQWMTTKISKCSMMNYEQNKLVQRQKQQ